MAGPFKHSREARHVLTVSKFPYAPGTGNIPVPVGQYGKVKKNADGSCTFEADAFVDDVLAFLTGVANSNPNMPREIVKKMASLMDDFDARAEKKHGYSDSPDERAYGWSSRAALIESVV